MRKYKSPYSEVIRFEESDIVTSSGLTDIGTEGGTDENGGTVDDGIDFGDNW